MTQSIIQSRQTFLLHSNEVPLEHELHEIRYKISEGEGEILDLDAQIQHLSVATKRLTRQRERTRDHVALLKGVVSPVRRIPAEIVALIFMLSVPVCDDIGLDPKHSPLFLAHICAFWRNVAFSTPVLWSRLATNIGGWVDVDDLALANQWIARAGCLPLKLSLYGSSERDNRLGKSLLRSVIHRLQKLRLTLNLEILESLAPVLNMDMPLLENLELNHHDSGSNFYWDWDKAPIEFLRSPRLHTVLLEPRQSSPFGFLNQDILRLPWPQLTRLELNDEDINTSEVRRIFTLSANLVECTLSIAGWPLTQRVPPLPTSIHPNLQTLTLIVTGDALSPFFHHLTLPALRHLAITHYSTVTVDISMLQSNLAALQHRSSFHLDTFQLDLKNVSVNAQSLVQFLDRAPTLRTLHLQCDGLDHAFVHALTYRPTDARPLVPRLEDLSLSGFTSSTTLRHQDIVEMVKSRWWERAKDAPVVGIARLKEVYLSFDFNRNALEEIEALQRKGLALTVEAYRSPMGIHRPLYAEPSACS